MKLNHVSLVDLLAFTPRMFGITMLLLIKKLFVHLLENALVKEIILLEKLDLIICIVLSNIFFKNLKTSNFLKLKIN
jgi:hypothetical protein